MLGYHTKMAWAGNLNVGEDFGTQSAWPDGSNITSNSAISNVASGRTAIQELSPHMPNVVSWNWNRL